MSKWKYGSKRQTKMNNDSERQTEKVDLDVEMRMRLWTPK